MTSENNEGQGTTAGDVSQIEQASRAVAWNGVYSVCATLFAMAASILTVRLLTVAEYGAFTVAANYLRYISILSLFTLDAALLRYIPEFRAKGDRRGLINLIYKVMAVHVVVWLLLTGLIVGIAGWLSELNNVDLLLLLYTGVAVILPSVIYVSLQAVLTSFFAIKIQAIGCVIGGVLQLLSLWIFIKVLGLGGPGAMLGQIGMSGFLLLLFAYCITRLPLPQQTTDYRPIQMKRLLSFSAPFVINAVAGAVFLRQSEVFFLQPFHGEEITATYSYAYMVAQRFLEFVPAMLYGIGNVLSAQAFLKSREQLAHVMSIYWRVTAVAITAVSLGGFVLGDRLILLLYGSKAAEAGLITSILFVTQAIIIFVNPYNFVMRAEEKTWLGFWLSPPAAIISLSCSLLLIPRFGLMGAVAATSLSFALVSVLHYFVFHRVFPYLTMPFGYIARCYGASFFMLLAWPVKVLIPGHTGLFVGMICVVLFWIAGARIFHLIGPDEADLIKRSKLPGSEFFLKVMMR